MFFTIASIVFFFIIIIVSNFIEDPNLKVAYWLMIFLLYISYANIYMSTYFYAQLRENPGIQGERGMPGEAGAPGSDGMCVITPNCHIPKCADFIEDTMTELYPEYVKVKTKLDNGESLTDSEQKLKQNLNTFKEILIPQCENSDMTVDEFKKEIKNATDIN